MESLGGCLAGRDVVGVSGHSLGPEGHDHVRPRHREDLRDPIDQLLPGRLRNVSVRIAEEVHIQVLHAEHVERVQLLFFAHSGQRLGRGQRRIGDLTGLAAAHDDQGVADLVRPHRQDAADPVRVVVRMGEDRREPVGHDSGT